MLNIFVHSGLYAQICYYLSQTMHLSNSLPGLINGQVLIRRERDWLKHFKKSSPFLYLAIPFFDPNISDFKAVVLTTGDSLNENLLGITFRVFKAILFKFSIIQGFLNLMSLCSSNLISSNGRQLFSTFFEILHNCGTPGFLGCPLKRLPLVATQLNATQVWRFSCS